MNPKNVLSPVSDGPVSRSIRHENITVEGYSRAAVQTYWRIPEFRLGFDLGWQPWEFMGTPNWFISHTHMDHTLALPAYVARRRMMKMDPPNIFVPASKVGEVRQLLAIFSRLDRGHLPCNIVGMEPGDSVELSKELVVSAIQTFHTITSIGFIVWERRKKLKPEYLSLSGPEIRELNLSGVPITDEIRIPKVAYLGDSTHVGLDRNPDLYRTEVLILEMTFVAPNHRREAINKHGHFHLDDLVERKSLFQNKKIIASHFSTRYTNQQIEQTVRGKLPDLMENRLILWY
ncbi:MAG: MBL fold metallo-hydrolase [Planctomycetia bacterium]|nr:MBL fold metallo-hydrolase [Planctomycetia bacterium]